MYKILIIEDETILREGLIDLLDINRFSCEICGEARNGKEGIEMIRTLHPDIVFIDLHMPILNGMDVLRMTMLKENYQAIIISGYTDFHHAKEAISLGVVEYILKPIDEKELNRAMEKVIQKLANTKKEAYNSNYSLITNQVISYIFNNLNKDITLNELADFFQISTDHLNKTFKHNTNITIHQYLIQTRIKKACELLEKENALVYEVGNKVGFKEYKYFYQVFKQQMNESPRSYQKRMSMNHKK